MCKRGVLRLVHDDDDDDDDDDDEDDDDDDDDDDDMAPLFWGPEIEGRENALVRD